MNRRTFLQVAAAAPAVLSAEEHTIPKYRVVSHFTPAALPGMPGPYPGQVASVHAEKCIDDATEKPDRGVVGEMMARGMRALTGDADVRDSWARFITPADVVGIKVNCSGAPGIMSSPVVVAEIVRNVVAVGVKPDAIWIYERFQDQVNPSTTTATCRRACTSGPRKPARFHGVVRSRHVRGSRRFSTRTTRAPT